MRAGGVDLVVLDLMMPRVTGWEVLDARAASTELARIPVIVITADRGDRVTRILDQGITALLPKPFELETLYGLVKSCLPQDVPVMPPAQTG
jgi:CheY-like chemotaxis protein